MQTYYIDVRPPRDCSDGTPTDGTPTPVMCLPLDTLGDILERMGYNPATCLHRGTDAILLPNTTMATLAPIGGTMYSDPLKLWASKSTGVPHTTRPDFYQRFRDLLDASSINRPKDAILDVIKTRLPLRLIGLSTASDAEHLYREASLIPGASTVAHFFSNLNLQINGPQFTRYDDGPPSILIALDHLGTPRVVKLLEGKRTSTELCLEAEACTELCSRLDSDLDNGCVSADVLTLQLEQCHISTGHPPGSYPVIVMPRYVCSVASQLPSRPKNLARALKRMIKAIEHIHSLGWIHMDVKAANTFVDMAGLWYVGDFGSAVRKGKVVTSTTSMFNETNWIGKPASECFDWYMLAVMGAAELHKSRWRDQLIEDGPNGLSTPKAKLLASVARVEDTDLTSVFSDILDRCAALVR